MTLRCHFSFSSFSAWNFSSYSPSNFQNEEINCLCGGIFSGRRGFSKHLSESQKSGKVNCGPVPGDEPANDATRGSGHASPPSILVDVIIPMHMLGPNTVGNALGSSSFNQGTHAAFPGSMVPVVGPLMDLNALRMPGYLRNIQGSQSAGVPVQGLTQPTPGHPSQSCTAPRAGNGQPISTGYPAFLPDQHLIFANPKKEASETSEATQSAALKECKCAYEKQNVQGQLSG